MKNMTFMIMGDAHLDSDFARDCNERRREQKAAFEEALSLVKKYSFDYLFIPGDLFDKRIPDRETVNYVKNSFAALKKTTVIISPGNHDPYTIDSPYYDGKWPENVHIFTERQIGMFEFGGRANVSGEKASDRLFSEGIVISETRSMRVYGAAFDGHFIKESLANGENGNTPKLVSGYVNVLMMHGTFSNDNSSQNPLDENELVSSGFDFCVIGGTHKQRKDGKILSSGVLYPRGFDEPGDSGVVVGEITEDKKVLTEFIPINKMVYDILDFDISDELDLSAEALSLKTKLISKEGHSVRVRLVGKKRYGETIDTKNLSDLLLGYFTYAEVTDDTRISEDRLLITNENSPRGIFMKLISEKEPANEDEKKPHDLSEDELKEAGFKALGLLGRGE